MDWGNEATWYGRSQSKKFKMQIDEWSWENTTHVGKCVHNEYCVEIPWPDQVCYAWKMLKAAVWRDGTQKLS
jgi:hypothetical protein